MSETDSLEMPFTSHIRELRNRVIFSVGSFLLILIISFATYKYYIDALISPLPKDMQVFSITEAFMMQIKISIYLTFAVSFPIHVYNVVAFILPALKEKEKRALKWGIGVSFLLIVIGLYLSYFQVMPIMVEFLLSPDNFLAKDVGVTINFEQGVMLMFKLILGFVVLFQLPLVLEILMALNLVTRKTLLKHARYAVVIIFILSALVTPPDPFSQVLLALPLILLFYISILVAKFLGFGNDI